MNTLQMNQAERWGNDHNATVDLTLHSFGGDCVYHLQRHFVDSLHNDTQFESHGADYLKTIQLVEAVYQSASQNQVIHL